MDHHQFRKLLEVYPDDPKAAFRPSWKSNDYKIQANKKFREKLQLGPFSQIGPGPNERSIDWPFSTLVGERPKRKAINFWGERPLT